MSVASTTRTIKFISKAGTYTAVIVCPDGDLYQEWEGTLADITKIFPNFEQTKPVLYFVCTSSREIGRAHVLNSSHNVASRMPSSA